MTLSFTKSLLVPSPITCLATGSQGHFCAGSDDGSFRVYNIASFKVVTAIQGLGDEIASIVHMSTSSSMGDVWVACGHHILRFNLDSEKMIQKASDAGTTIKVLSNEEDILNEISLSAIKGHLSFGADSGTVGTVDLSSATVSTMKAKHSSICGFVKFIPNRPRELFSGGYDHALMHFDFMERKLLSRYTVPSASAEGGMTLSPPFIMCTAISPSGIFAAGTADGRLLVGFGGERRAGGQSKSKRSRKWEGLDESSIISNKLAEGPIVAVLFNDSEHLMLTSLLGHVGCYRIARDEIDDSVRLDATCKFKTRVVEKVNALLLAGNMVLVGGLTKDSKGAIEVWGESVDNK